MQGVRKRILITGMSAMCVLPVFSAWGQQAGEPPALTAEAEASTYRLDVDAGQNNRDLIIRIAPDSSEEIVYTAQRIEEFILAPDERQLAIIQSSASIVLSEGYTFEGLDVVPSDLIILDLETGETQQANERETDIESRDLMRQMLVSTAAWSPDSDALAYVWEPYALPYGSDDVFSDTELRLYTLTTGETTLLENMGRDPGDPLRLAWFSEPILLQVRGDAPDWRRGFYWFNTDGEQVRQDLTQDSDAPPVCGGLESSLADSTNAVVLPGEPNNLRVAPYLDAPVVGQVAAGESLFLGQGTTVCVDDIRFWSVTTADGTPVWTAESADGEYFLAPADGE